MLDRKDVRLQPISDDVEFRELVFGRCDVRLRAGEGRLVGVLACILLGQVYRGCSRCLLAEMMSLAAHSSILSVKRS